MQSLKEDVVTTLVELEMGFDQTTIGTNTEKLKKFLAQENEKSIEVDQFIKHTKARMLETYDWLEDSNELEIDIIEALSNKLANKEISSAKELRNESFIKSLDNAIVYAPEYTNVGSIGGQSSELQELMEDIAMAALISQDMSLEEIEQLQNIFMNSSEYIKTMTSYMDKLFNPNTADEQQAASKIMSLKEINNRTENHLAKNKGTKADRAAIILVLRKAMSREPKMMQEALITAKKFGLDSMIMDGKIDFGKGYELYREAIKGNEKLESKASTQKDFEKYIGSISRRSGESTLKRYLENREFSEKFNQCKTEEEKQQVIEQERQNEETRRNAIIQLDQKVKSGDKNIEELMERLADSNLEKAKKVLMHLASRENTDVHIQAKIVAFANERFAKEKLLDEEEKIENPEEIKEEVASKPQAMPKRDEDEGWGR